MGSILFHDIAVFGSGTACGTELKVNEEHYRAPTQQTRIREAAERPVYKTQTPQRFVNLCEGTVGREPD